MDFNADAICHRVQNVLAAFIQKNAPEVKLQLTADYEESLARLIDRRADAAALNFQVGAALAKRLYPNQITIPGAMFSQEEVSVAVRKGQKSELLTRLNTGLAADQR